MNADKWFYDERSYHKYLCVNATEDELPLLAAALSAKGVPLGGHGPCRRPASNGAQYRYWLRVVPAKPSDPSPLGLIANALERWSAPALELVAPEGEAEARTAAPTLDALVQEGLNRIEAAVERVAAPNLWTTAIDGRLVGIERAVERLAILAAGAGEGPLTETLRQLDKIREECGFWEEQAKRNEARASRAEAAQREAEVALSARAVEVEDLRRAVRQGAERPPRGTDRLEQMVEAAFASVRFEAGSLDVLLGEFYDPVPTIRELGRMCADPSLWGRWKSVQRAKPWREGPHLQTGNGDDGRLYALQTKPCEFRVLIGQKVDQERDIDRMARHRS